MDNNKNRILNLHFGDEIVIDDKKISISPMIGSTLELFDINKIINISTFEAKEGFLNQKQYYKLAIEFENGDKIYSKTKFKPFIDELSKNIKLSIQQNDIKYKTMQPNPDTTSKETYEKMVEFVKNRKKNKENEFEI